MSIVPSARPRVPFVRVIAAFALSIGACTPPTVTEDGGLDEVDADGPLDASTLDAPALDAPAPDAPLHCDAPASPTRIVVTADWLARSLTILGLDRALDPGCTASEAILGTVDLSAYAPGPLEVELAPGGHTAVVAVGPGFFEGAGAALVGMPELEAGAALLVVDVDARTVAAEIALAHAPMGIAIAPDGARAYVAEYGTNAAPGTELAVIDLATRALVEEIAVGPRPEQVVLSADGTLGAVTVDDGTRVFRVADVRGSLSPTLATGRDPSGVAFVPARPTLVITNSMAASISIVDVTDPIAPVLVASPAVRGVPYPVAVIPGTTEVLVGTSVRESLYVFDVTMPALEPRRITLAHGPFVLEAEPTPDGRHALVAHPAQRALVAVDLETGAEHVLSWLDATGPTYVAIAPDP